MSTTTITWPSASLRLLALGRTSVDLTSGGEGGLHVDLWVLTSSTRIVGL